MIVAGFGFRAGATVESLLDALRSASGGLVVGRLAAPADKAAAECMLALGALTGVPVVPVPAEALGAVKTLTRSLRVQAERGVGSVAEASALAAAGVGARLLGPRTVSGDRMATAALAVGDGV